jgi:ubiquinone/menaquinone biosynthesis C-methylase UbiE
MPMDRSSEAAGVPGPADVEYISAAQAGGWGQTLAAFVRFLALPAGASVLDVGTGPGLLPRLLVEAGARWAVGVDDSPAMLRRAVALCGDGRDALAWVEAPVLRLPFAAADDVAGSEAFDAVLATNLLFLLPDPAAGLRELGRVTRRGGTVAFMHPNETMSVDAAAAFMDARGIGGFDRFSFVNYARLAEAYPRLSTDAWAALARAAGLAELRTQTRSGGMVLLMAGVRL